MKAARESSPFSKQVGLLHIVFWVSALISFAAWPLPTLAAGGDEETLKALMEQGEDVYLNKACVVCHQSNGMGLSGSFPPLVKGAPFDASPSIIQPLERLGLYKNGVIALGEAETQVDVVVNGIPGTRMLAFGSQLSNEEIAAVVTYIRNAWGNDTGEIVTLEQVEAVRQE